MKKKNEDVFTWSDLKKIVNAMPDERLCDEIHWWGDERGGTFDGVQILEEDYHDDGDTGTMPKSIMLENLGDETEDDYPLIFVKGTHILTTDNY